MTKILTASIFEMGLKRYLAVSTLIFDKEMGLRLKELRTAMKLSQADLAELLGLSQTDIHRLETGKLSTASCNSEVFRRVLLKNFEYLVRPSGWYNLGEITWRFDEKRKDWICVKVNPDRV